MANEKNLIPMNQRTESEQRKIAHKGGVASGLARRENRRFKQIFNELMKSDTNGISTKEALCTAIIKKALNGDVKAFEFIFNKIGDQSISDDF